MKGKKTRRRTKRSSEKGLEDWMGAGVWRVVRTAEDRLHVIIYYRRSMKGETSGNG